LRRLNYTAPIKFALCAARKARAGICAEFVKFTPKKQNSRRLFHFLHSVIIKYQLPPLTVVKGRAVRARLKGTDCRRFYICDAYTARRALARNRSDFIFRAGRFIAKRACE